jgi:hypothetical protein
MMVKITTLLEGTSPEVLMFVLKMLNSTMKEMMKATMIISLVFLDMVLLLSAMLH